MSANFRQRLQEILNAHDEAFRVLDEVEDAVHGASDTLRQMIDAQDRIYNAQKQAIQAARAANRAALDLLAHLDVQ